MLDNKKTYSKLTALLFACSLASFFLLPIFALLASALSGSLQSMQHLWETVFTDYLINSLFLVLGTTLLSACFALPCAFWFPVTIFQVEPFYNGYSVYRWLFQPIYPLIFTLIFLIIPVSCNKPYEMCLIGKVNKITGFPTFVALAARALSLPCRSTLTFFCSPEWH